jgi:signal transduction histidine kinase
VSRRADDQVAFAKETAIELAVRRRLARELHDRVAQTLTSMLVEVESFKAHRVEWDDVIRQLDMVQTSTRQVLSSIRQLLHELRDESAPADNFVESLSELIARFKQRTRIAAEIDVRPGWPKNLSRPASLNLYRIVEEALANVRMHSGARSVRILLESYPDQQLGVVIDDDGRGVDTHPARPLGLGTVGMKERAVFLGGTLRIESEAGGGTAVLAVFPRDQLIAEQTDPYLQAAVVDSMTA